MAVKKKTWRIILISITVIIVLLAIAKSAGWLGESNVLKVTTEKVSRHDIIETVSANGKVQPEVEVKISADVSGEVVEMNVKEGDVIKKGTLLCRINPEIYVSMLDRMEASLNGAKASWANSKSRLVQSQSQWTKADLNFQRNKKLFDQGAISASDFESIKSAWEVAKAEVDAANQSVSGAEFSVRSSEASLKEARENLNKTSIYAPVDGTISRLNVEKGERVVGTSQMAGTEIMRIANLNEMEVSVDVSENDIVRVHSGDTADVEVDAYQSRKFKGIVTEVANSASLSSSVSVTDQVTNFTVKVRIVHESYADLIPEGKPDYSPFRPGMSATVDIRTNSMTQVLSVPIQAVTTRDTTKKVKSKNFKLASGEKKENSDSDNNTGSAAESKATEVQECVFLVIDGKAVMQAVKTGIQDNTWIEVTEGLKGDEQVISAPFNAISKTLDDGNSVKVVSREELFDKEE